MSLPDAVKSKLSTTVGNTSSADFTSFFECPVCREYVLPPILQCKEGHLVCSVCRPKLKRCPTWRGPLGKIRNLAMEKLANSVYFPCKHSSNGCTTSLLPTEKTEHEDACEFRPYMCPYPNTSCKWQGTLEQVLAHLIENHKSISMVEAEDFVFKTRNKHLPTDANWVSIQSCFGHHFMLVIRKLYKNDDHKFFIIVQLIVSRQQSEKFSYKVKLTNGHRRRLTWVDTARSIHHERMTAAKLNSDCLVFDHHMAQMFADNGDLVVDVTILNNHSK